MATCKVPVGTSVRPEKMRFVTFAMGGGGLDGGRGVALIQRLRLLLHGASLMARERYVRYYMYGKTSQAFLVSSNYTIVSSPLLLPPVSLTLPTFSSKTAGSSVVLLRRGSPSI